MEGVWSKPGTLDHSLMYGSVLVSQTRESTREGEEAFETSMPSYPDRGSASPRVESLQEPYIAGKSDLKNGIEMNVTRTR